MVTDAAGIILRANARAREILGLPAGELPMARRLAAHLASDASGPWTLPSQSGLDQAKVRLGPIGGLCSEVRVRRVEERMEARDVVWLLNGAEQQDWSYDHAYIEETVQEVARQVRGPLLLASSLAGRIAREVQQGAGPMAKQVRAEIDKADITFERLAEAIGVRREPKRDERRIDLGTLLKEIVVAMPERDRPPVEIKGADRVEVMGDRERLGFALRTLLGNLLATIRDVHIELVGEGDATMLRMHANFPMPSERSHGNDRLAEVTAVAREAAGRGLDTVQAVLRAHDGSLVVSEDGYTIHLPPARGAAA